MAKITPEIKEVTENTRIFALATASKDGVPNVAYIRFGKIFTDDELLFIDNFMLKTRKNIDENPKVAVLVWGKDSSKAFQFKGTARVETSGDTFDKGMQWVSSINPKLNPKAVVVVKIDDIYISTAGANAGKKVE